MENIKYKWTCHWCGASVTTKSCNPPDSSSDTCRRSWIKQNEEWYHEWEGEEIDLSDEDD